MNRLFYRYFDDDMPATVETLTKLDFVGEPTHSVEPRGLTPAALYLVLLAYLYTHSGGSGLPFFLRF